MLSTMTGGPGGNGSRVMVILAWPGATALTSWAGGCAAEQPAHQTAKRSEPQIRTRMIGAAYACRAKHATAPAGGDVLHGTRGGLNLSHEERTDIGGGRIGFQRLRRRRRQLR